MPVSAHCPDCGNKLSETSVVAGAPHCTACGSWIVGVNGTLGLTSAYGHGDSSLTRRRVEADLSVLHEYQMRYTGMMEDCKQRLLWSAAKYAALPQPPEFLEVKKFGYDKWLGYAGIAVCVMALPLVCSYVVSCSFYHLREASGTGEFFGHWPAYNPLENPLLRFLFEVLCGWLLIIIIGGGIDFGAVASANGNRPQENAHRKQKYERDVAIAMRDAERKKAAEDHRLRVQIRELEGEIKAVGDKAADVRRILTAL